MKPALLRLTAAALTMASSLASAAAAPGSAYMPVGGATTAPIGYVQFCQDNPDDCRQEAVQPRDVVLSAAAWRDLNAVNREVNEDVKPLTDQDHYGKVEVWAYPTDGYGDCEDYVLEKRRTLIDAGWPRSALLITVVRDHNGDGHAVLTVKTDRGEFILDNQDDAVLPWQSTDYRYVKRQSQPDQNAWVSLGDRQPAPLVASGTN